MYVIFVCMHVCNVCMHAWYVRMHVCIFFFPWRYSPKWARPSLSRLHYYSQTHHIQFNSSGRVITPNQRPLPDKTQHSQETDILGTDGIRTLNRSKRAAVDPRLRPCGHSRIYCLRMYIYMYICVLLTSL